MKILRYLLLLYILLLTLVACGGANTPSVVEEVPPSGPENGISAGANTAYNSAGGDVLEEEDSATQELTIGETSPDEQNSGTTTEESRPVPESSGSGSAANQSPEKPFSSAPLTPPAESAPSAGEDHGPSEETGTPSPVEETPQPEESEEETVDQSTFYVSVGGVTFTASFADTVGAQGLKELLAAGPATISMSDYGGFEKVGALGQSLPTSNSQTTAQAGDIVLYQGNQIVIFYGSNAWSYTRLGKIDDLTGWEDALGSGDVSVTFSLTA